MEAQQAQGLLETQPLHETDEETVVDVDFTSIISEEEKEELKIELAKLEDEISTLRQVLVAKEKHLAELKQKLGISLMNELKQNFSKSWHDMQTTSANSPTFKSFEEKVETTVTSLKTKVGGTNHSGGSFEDVLSSAAHASAQSSIASPQLPENKEELQC
ncbi:tumor protein D53 isoform X2 [Pelodiscus sinensis]|uniref:tumor protein D53 isoform X2 n=1 Tax=Pelodiscus sinensis TaxID=13735 RepID=UPI003F6D1E4A